MKYKWNKVEDSLPPTTRFVIAKGILNKCMGFIGIRIFNKEDNKFYNADLSECENVKKWKDIDYVKLVKE